MYYDSLFQAICNLLDLNKGFAANQLLTENEYLLTESDFEDLEMDLAEEGYKFSFSNQAECYIISKLPIAA